MKIIKKLNWLTSFCHVADDILDGNYRFLIISYLFTLLSLFNSKMEDHSNNYKRKSKGGTEKIREKKQTKLQIEVDSCFKIKDMFKKSFTTQ